LIRKRSRSASRSSAARAARSSVEVEAVGVSGRVAAEGGARLAAVDERENGARERAALRRRRRVMRRFLGERRQIGPAEHRVDVVP